MSTGRGRRNKRQVDSGRAVNSETEPNEQNEAVESTTLELILKKINEFDRKLQQLGSNPNSVQNESASVSSLETNGVVDNGVNSTINRQESISPASASSSLTPSETRNVYVVQPSVSKPTFDGKPFTNPIAFLKRLKKYIRAVNGSDREIDIALGCITGHARRVMELYSKGWTIFADFEADFRRIYWTEQIQESVRYRLTNAVYANDSGMTMSEHFAEHAESMQSLTIAFSERDIVNSIMRHYAIDIQRLWFTRTEEASIISGVDFLRSIEQNIVERPMGVTRGVVGRNPREGRYNRQPLSRPIVATISTNRWKNRENSTRGRGYRQGRLGYRTSFNRPTASGIEQERPNTRQAITFVKESESAIVSKHTGEGQSKN